MEPHICNICHKLLALRGIPYTQKSPIIDDVRACATRGRRPKRMHFPIKGSVELKVPWLVNCSRPSSEWRHAGLAGDLPGGAQYLLVDNFHALAVSLWKAFPVRDLGGWGTWLINM
jgi:hypothetical protein